MKSKITILALALFVIASINAATPVSWSVLASSGSGYDKGEVVWGDFNNDGYLDLFQITNSSFALYQNNGDETFTNVASAKFPATNPLQQASAIFLDYNNDGNLDLVVSGWNGTTSETTLYKNSGAPNYTFTIDTNNSLLGVRTGKDEDAHRILSAVDYNNDGWVDLFMEGWCDALGTRIVTLYKNVSGTFVRQTTPVGGTADFEGMSGGSLHTGDVNHDGFIDMICSGYTNGGVYATNLFLNQGNGTFVKSNAAITGIEQGEVVLFDSNNDGWPDIYVAGVGYENGNWVWPGKLYLNNQDGTFTVASGTNLPGGYQGLHIAQGDVNNDGKTDLMIMLPYSGTPNGNTAVFYNNGDNTFTQDIPECTGRGRGGSLDFADFNNDNKLDYFLFGYRDGYTFPDNTNIGGNWASTFVKNMGTTTNQAPSIPANITATKVNDQYIITWDKSTDDITPQNAIRYNVYVQDQTGKIYSFSPANITSGRLKTGSPTLLYKNEFDLNLAPGQYTVGVQAVDQANVASAFATKSLSITTKLENTQTSKVNVLTMNKNIEIQNTGDQRVAITLLSLNGQTLFNGLCSAGSRVQLPINLNQGVYLVKLSQDNTIHTVKVSIL